MSSYVFQGGLEAPGGKYKEILDYALTPSLEPKQIDLCCGLGFGKTILSIQLAALTLNHAPGHMGLFFEPDWDRVDNVFLPLWHEHVPEELYDIAYGKRLIVWKPTGAQMIYRARVITGSKERARSKNRGIPSSFVIDDETAIGFDMEQYQNTFARIRVDADIRYYATLTTPMVGPYGRFLKRGGNKIFKGRTADNFMLLRRDPTYEIRQRKGMSTQQARRELDGELVALEGRIWKEANLVMPREDQDFNDPDYKASAWPNGNRDDEWSSYNPKAPYWLLCDLGSATASYVVVQQREATYHGHRLFDGSVWVAVADLCPDSDASASRAFQKIKEEFGIPAGISAGADVNTRAQTDGRTVAYFANQIFGSNTRIYPCNESIYNKLVQFDQLTYLICSSIGDQRRFTVARDFVSMDSDSHRGVVEMIDEDQYPPIDQRRVQDFLPKDKTNVVQHTRDALLMGAAMIMHPPTWTQTANPPK